MNLRNLRCRLDAEPITGRRVPSPKIRRYPSILLSLLFVYLIIPLVAESNLQDSEYKVKAHILNRIIEFIEWPRGVGMEDKEKPFIIGVIDSNPFENYMEDHFVVRKINGKKILIKYFKEPYEVTGCHALFISSNVSRKKLAKILDYTSERPILTMADSEDFLDSGVILNLLTYRNASDRLVNSVHMNEGALRRAGLKNGIQDFFKIKTVINRNPFIETEEKARIIEKFAKTSIWPQSNPTTESKLFVIKVLGNSVFNSHLEKVFKNTKINGKKVKIQTIARTEDISDANLLFISRSKYTEINDILAYTKKKAILTVSDTEGFSDKGVHLNILYDNGRFRYESNIMAAAESGIYFSSTLNNNPNIRVISKK